MRTLMARMVMMRRCAAVVALVVVMASCAGNPPPAVVGGPGAAPFADLVVPPGLAAPAAVTDRHQRAAADLQAGRVREAAAGFSDALKRAPGFYPAQTGLGDVALAQKQYAKAAAAFDAALATNAKYMPALLGRVDASLALKDEPTAIEMLERVVTLEPKREEARNRLDVLRVRAVERELTAARKARSAGDLDGARAAYERARVMSPSSAVVLRGLAEVELAAGALDAAAKHARSAVALDATDPDSFVLLADVLDKQGLLSQEVDAMARAVAIDPRPAWRTRLDETRRKAAAAALPAEYAGIPASTAVTRAQVAAYIGIHLQAVVDHAPSRGAVVMTDVRDHWAATWILAVTRAGIMDAMANHTFQPRAVVTRTDLARAVAQVLGLLASSRPKDAAEWRAAKPVFVDVPPAHLAYPAAALAVAAGAMTAESGRFAPTRSATGADLVAAVTRLERLAGK